VRAFILTFLGIGLNFSVTLADPSSQPVRLWPNAPRDERHGIVATDTSGWDGPTVPMQGPKFFDAIGMKWWYEYSHNSKPTNTFAGYPRLYMYWRATLGRKAEQIQADARTAAEACPGQTVCWAISNEPNEHLQANQTGKEYAAIYYHYHRNLKIGDPNCRIMGAGILNWDFKSSTTFQRGKDWYEEFRQTWRDNPTWRSYSQKNYGVEYPPQDAFNFHAYDLRGVAGTPFAPEDWRYSRDQILKCYADIRRYPEVLNKKIWLTEFGALRAPTMEDNIALCGQLVGWMREQPYMERWFWFLLHSDKHGNWPKLELLTDEGERTELGAAALELATLPNNVKVIPVNHDYANHPQQTYLRKGWSEAPGLIEVTGDHPRYHLIQKAEFANKAMCGRTIPAPANHRIRKVLFRVTSNYDPDKVQLVIDAIDAAGRQQKLWQNNKFGPRTADISLTCAAAARVRSIGVAMAVQKPFTYEFAHGEWQAAVQNLVLYTEPDVK
jgi:hypothetical protein